MASHVAQAPRHIPTMPTRTYSPKRVVWRRVALSSSLVTLAAMASLLGAYYFRVPLAALYAGASVTGSLRANDPAIESLGKKIAAENEERVALQSKRTELASSIQQMPTLVLTPAERKRRQLANQLVHLLALEKQYPEDSPEITDARERIDTLQSQIADMPLAGQRLQIITPPARTSLEAQLADTDRQISQNELQTKADVSQLGELMRATESTASHGHSLARYAAPDIVLISLLLGLISGLIVLVVARIFSVRNEVSLRRLLPPTVEVLGTVPQMRARP